MKWEDLRGEIKGKLEDVRGKVKERLNYLFFSLALEGDPFFHHLKNKFKRSLDEKIKDKDKKVEPRDFLTKKLT